MSGQIYVEDGRPLASLRATASELAEHDKKDFVTLGVSPYVSEPGTPTERTLRVEVHDSCQGDHFVVREMKVNLLRAR